MEFNGWSSFEDLVRACGYTKCHDDSDNTREKSNNTTKNEFCNTGCCDIPNGFQSLNPQLFILIGEILGNMLAGNIPSNVQNAFGNWLELVGQAILTYSAQQQYFEQGPGRYFNPKNYNINNSFCNTTPQNTNQNNSSSKSKEKNLNYDYNRKSSSEDKVDKIEELESRINQLIAEMDRIKNKMEK